MSHALEGLGSLPGGIHAAVAIMLAAGLVVWLMGQRFVKHVVVVLGAAVGAILGFLLTPMLIGSSTAGAGTLYQGLLVGLFVGAIIGLLMFRSAMALALGVVGGVLLPLAAASVLHFWPLSSETAKSVAGGQAGWSATLATYSRETRLLSHSPLLSVGDAEPATTLLLASLEDKAESAKLLEPLKEPAHRVRAFVDQVRERTDAEWSQVPAAHKAIIVLAAAIGLAGGVILGLRSPTWGAAACTSMFGSAVWLAALVWLSNAMSAPWKAALDRGPVVWLCIWGVAALVGMIVQWSGVLGPARKAAPRSAAAPAPAAPAR